MGQWKTFSEEMFFRKIKSSVGTQVFQDDQFEIFISYI